MRRRAFVLVALVSATVALVLVTRDDPPGDSKTAAGPRASQASPRSRPRITQPAKRIPCPNPLYDPPEEPRPSSSAFDARELLGLAVRAAEQRAGRAGCSVRIVQDDGRGLVRTDDIVPSRIDVAVESGVVVSIEGVG